MNLHNLGQSQIHQLIQKGKDTDELKQIWQRYGAEYPYYTDCTGALHKYES